MTYNDLQERIHQNIRRVKVEKKLSNRKLAKITGMSDVTISFVMSGRRNVTLYTLWALAEAFDVDIKELFE